SALLAGIARLGVPAGIIQKRNVPSELAETSSLPSGRNATAFTHVWWPVRVFRNLPVAASHSLMVPSTPAVASRFSVGLKATLSTAPLWPVSVCRDFPVFASQMRAV